MVTTKFSSSFLEEKVQDEDDIDIVREDNEAKAVGEHGDMTSFYSMSEVVTQAVETFNLDVNEAADLDDQVEDFGGKRQFTDRIKRTVEKYGESYEEDLLEDIVDQVRVEDLSAGDSLWNFLKSPEADILAENAERELEEITSTQETDAIADQIEEELEAEYQEAAQQVYEQHEEEINKAYHLSQISGQEISLSNFDTFNWLKSKQYDSNWNDELEISEISNSLESELDTQIRAKTLESLESQAHKVAADKYEEITGEKPDEVGKEVLYSSRALMMTEDEETRDIVEDIMKKGDEVYLSADHVDISDIDYHHVDILKDGVGSETYDIGGKEVEIHVANPAERLRYGEEFQTCKSLTWEDSGESNEEVVKRSTALKDPIIYAEQENGDGESQVIAREILHYDMDGDYRELGNGRMYRSLESREDNKELEEAMNDYKDRMRSELAVPTDEQRSAIEDADIQYSVTSDWYAPENAPQV
jgi:hypothetical protein